jgi:transposase-like protein
MPKKIDPVVRERAVRLVMEHRGEYPSMRAAIKAVAGRERVGSESLRGWVAQAEIDSGVRGPHE